MRAIEGREAIARYFGRSARSFFDKHGQELMETGVVFIQKMRRPPRRVFCAFPENLRAWQISKSQKGDEL